MSFFFWSYLNVLSFWKFWVVFFLPKDFPNFVLVWALSFVSFDESLLFLCRGLADTKQTGKLNREQFSLAMYLIEQKTNKGIDPPSTLTPDMIPPSEQTAASAVVPVSHVTKILQSYFSVVFVPPCFAASVYLIVHYFSGNPVFSCKIVLYACAYFALLSCLTELCWAFITFETWAC